MQPKEALLLLMWEGVDVTQHLTVNTFYLVMGSIQQREAQMSQMMGSGRVQLCSSAKDPEEQNPLPELSPFPPPLEYLGLAQPEACLPLSSF